MKTLHLSILLCPVLLFVFAEADADEFVNGQAADVVLGQPDFVTNSAMSLPNRVVGPESVAWDPVTGKVFVGDSGHNRILRFSSMAAATSGSNPEAVFGQPNFNSYSSNQGGAAGPNTLGFFYQIMFDHEGRLWVADAANNRVLCWFAASSRASNSPADFVYGQPDFVTTTSGLTASTMQAPFGVWVDSSDALWVADASNNRVLRFDSISTKGSGAAADGVLGQMDFDSNASATTITGMNTPRSVSVDASGRLWVADTGSNRVLRFDAAASKTDGASADGVLGQPDFISGSFGTSALTMNFPTGVLAVGNTVWVGDTLNRRVIGFSDAASLPDGAPASTVLGKPDFVTSSGSVDSRNLSLTYNLSAGPGGSLFVADYGFHRVLRFSPLPTPAAATNIALIALRAQLLAKVKKLRTKAKAARKKGQSTKAARLAKKAKKLNLQAQST